MFYLLSRPKWLQPATRRGKVRRLEVQLSLAWDSRGQVMGPFSAAFPNAVACSWSGISAAGIRIGTHMRWWHQRWQPNPPRDSRGLWHFCPDLYSWAVESKLWWPENAPRQILAGQKLVYVRTHTAATADLWGSQRGHVGARKVRYSCAERCGRQKGTAWLDANEWPRLSWNEFSGEVYCRRSNIFQIVVI